MSGRLLELGAVDLVRRVILVDPCDADADDYPSTALDLDHVAWFGERATKVEVAVKGVEAGSYNPGVLDDGFGHRTEATR